MSAAQLEALKAALRARARPPSIEAWRAGFEANAARFPAVEGVRRARGELAGYPGEWTKPDGESAGALLYLHGGAFQIGSANSYAHVAGLLAREGGFDVFTLDYPLAPEHVFPAAWEASRAALRALIAQGPAAAAGDSSGGNLALAALQAEPGARAGVIISGYLDLTHSGASIGERAARDVFIDASTMPDTARLYAGAAALDDPRVSPLFGRAGELPPLLVLAGSEEVLHDDATRLAGRVRAAGGQARLLIGEGMVHVWPYFWPVLEEGRAALIEGARFIRAAFRA